VGLYSVESAADSLADESTEVSGELWLTDLLGAFRSRWYIRRSRLSQRSSINTTVSRITATTNPIKPTMSFSATSLARISVIVGVVDNARSSMDWTNSEQLSPPTHLLSNESLPESKEDDLVILRTRMVQRRFLDDEGKIELMGEKGPSDRKVESEVDLKEIKEEEVKEDKEPDEEWQATGTWPSWSNNAGKEWGWGANTQLMENDPWGPADPVTLDSLDGTLRTMDWNLRTIDGDVRELVRRARHQARAAQDQHVSPILCRSFL